MKEAWGKVIDAWNAATQGMEDIAEFERLLDAWGKSQVELIELARPIIEPKTAKQRKKREAGLTVKQRYFIEHYLINLNGALAARLAGYPARSSRQIAYENFQNPLIKSEIERRLAEAREKRQTEIDEQRRILEDDAIARAMRGLKR